MPCIGTRICKSCHKEINGTCLCLATTCPFCGGYAEYPYMKEFLENVLSRPIYLNLTQPLEDFQI
jgi:hypothetical protein